MTATPPLSTALPRIDRFKPRGESVRASRRAKWRAVFLLAVHVAAAAHYLQWRLGGETLTPVEPSESMQTLELGYLNAGFVLFVALIGSTLVFGRFFCGWACHFVAYQDACAWLMKRIGLKPRPVRSRLLLLVPAGAAYYMFVHPSVVRAIDGAPAAELRDHFTTTDFWATFPGPIVIALTVLVDGLLIVYWLGAKGFCTFGCPYGAIFGAVDRLAPGRIRVTDACDSCGHCTATCTSNVRVHEEVAKFGTVVDPGCLKCMDCVNVCPKEALYFGFGMPAVATRRRIGGIGQHRTRQLVAITVAIVLFLGLLTVLVWSGNTQLPIAIGLSTLTALMALSAIWPGGNSAKSDFSWPEEIALAVLFVLGLDAFRGLYSQVPFLLSLGLGVLTAVFGLTGWRLLRRPDLQFQNRPLKTDGHLTGVGLLAAAGIVSWLGFTVHSDVVQWRTWFGERAARAGLDQNIPLQHRITPLRESLEHLESAHSLGLFDSHAVRLWLGRVHRELGEFDQAELHLRRALELVPGSKFAAVDLADILAIRQQFDEAEQLIRMALDDDPSYPPAVVRMQRLEARRNR